MQEDSISRVILCQIKIISKPNKANIIFEVTEIGNLGEVYSPF